MIATQWDHAEGLRAEIDTSNARAYDRRATLAGQPARREGSSPHSASRRRTLREAR
jgi:hypothetical protein